MLQSAQTTQQQTQNPSKLAFFLTEEEKDSVCEITAQLLGEKAEEYDLKAFFFDEEIETLHRQRAQREKEYLKHIKLKKFFKHKGFHMKTFGVIGFLVGIIAGLLKTVGTAGFINTCIAALIFAAIGVAIGAVIGWVYALLGVEIHTARAAKCREEIRLISAKINVTVNESANFAELANYDRHEAEKWWP